jgi:hypothetical protein
MLGGNNLAGNLKIRRRQGQSFEGDFYLGDLAPYCLQCIIHCQVNLAVDFLHYTPGFFPLVQYSSNSVWLRSQHQR